MVLIIGILAAVALPQYQKAVFKARFSEIVTKVNMLSKAVDIWLLQNGGYPTNYVVFTGDEEDVSDFDDDAKRAVLDIDFPCKETDGGGYCYTDSGEWQVYCEATRCEIYLEQAYINNPLLGNTSALAWDKIGNSAWGLEYVRPSLSSTPQVCRIWRDTHGVAAIIGRAATTCADYL